MVNSQDIGDGFAARRVEFRVSRALHERYRRSTIRGGELLLTLVGANFGRVAIAPKHYEGFNCARPVAVVPLTVDPQFAMFALQSPLSRHYMDNWANTTAQPTLNLKDVANLPIPLPPSEEQLAIAQNLRVLDDKMELNRKMNETLEAIAQAIFKSWFVHFDPVRAKARGEPPESICRRLGLTPDILALFPDRLVDSELGEIPEGWEPRTVGGVADVIKGKSYKSSELGPSKTALVTLKSFSRGGGYRLDGLKEYTGSFRGEQEVFAGELIVAYTDVTQAADVIGKPALIVSDSRYEHLVISLDVAVIRPKRPEDRWFLYGMMSNDAFQQYTRAHTTGTTVLHLAAGAVPNFRFSWPNKGLVEAYAELTQPIFELIDCRVGESGRLGSIRDVLLPKLLSGELRVALETAA
ncbi:restriction endonuclease subunit S [Steroidobacter agaridevorans]|nr:restriction endonuclease subunit S [Steroidobacter agaridevorans]